MDPGAMQRRAAHLARVLFAVLATACTSQDRPALGDEGTRCSAEQRRAEDGGMLLTPGATSEPPRPDAAVFFWHPRAWDLHVWAGEDGVPTIAYENPNARRGGLALPAGSFLRSEVASCGRSPDASSARRGARMLALSLS